MANSAQPVVLTVPRGPAALSAMRLVVGWVASCHDMPLDQIDDINLALETLLAGEPAQGDALALTLGSADGWLDVSLAGLHGVGLRTNLRAGEAFAPSEQWPLDVRLFLGALLDEYGVEDCDSDSFSVLMRKQIC